MLNVRMTTLVTVAALVLAGPALAEKTAGQVIDDSTIATEVKAALIDKDKVSAGSLNVEVNKGTVQVAGFVESQAEKAAAMKTAQQIKGAVKVLDAMVVLPGHRTAGQTLDDTTIQATLKTKLAEIEGAGKAFSINTDVKMGHVLMSGFVHGDKARVQAGEIAKGISGVKQVHNFVVATH
jgi:hyperosmotically inducible periplasmic protein